MTACLIPHAALAQSAAPPEALPAAPKATMSGGTERRTQAIIDKVAQAWFRAEWNAYASSFITPEGRVVDNANGMVSHSEGQGYGLLLAGLAGDAERFDSLWRWTERNLKGRKDHLLSWKWDPAKGAIADLNNATDGDILVAWALAEGARRFHRPDYLDEARTLAKAIFAQTVQPSESGSILLPAVAGFGAKDQADGPVVNLSYWVFPAFRVLNELAPGHDWARLQADGIELLARSRFGAYRLPTDWQSVAGAASKPAKSFPARFGYDAIRIPLYLAWEGSRPALDALKRFAALPVDTFETRVAIGGEDDQASVARLDDAGYRMVLALARCATTGTPIDADLIKARDALYYPATLRLLSLAVLQERYPRCL